MYLVRQYLKDAFVIDADQYITRNFLPKTLLVAILQASAIGPKTLCPFSEKNPATSAFKDLLLTGIVKSISLSIANFSRPVKSSSRISTGLNSELSKEFEAVTKTLSTCGDAANFFANAETTAPFPIISIFFFLSDINRLYYIKQTILLSYIKFLQKSVI